ncbi:MAG: PrsW family intramembrane metalloprotease, partial [Candidatus Omnitrophica bacterium]|nr:PrsW family intramembrane metalloprotease [Candidatus Omnitrophota bacterium]
MTIETILPIVISFLLAVVPAVFLLWYFCRLAYTWNGSRAVMLKIFMVGILSIFPVVAMEIMISKINVYYKWSRFIYYFFEAFIVAGLVEEYIKMQIVKFFAYYNNRIHKIIDGIVYTVAASLGFACIENILYVFGNNWETAIARGVTSVPLHAVASGMMGYYIGLARFARTKSQEKLLLNVGLWQAIMIHGLYNFLILISPLFGAMFAAFVIPLVIYR